MILDKIEWHNGTTPIPKADIESKMVEVQAEYDAEQWKRNRQAEYPTTCKIVNTCTIRWWRYPYRTTI